MALLLTLIIIAVAGHPAAAKDVTGLNVRMADYGKGAFVQTGDKQWSEVNKSTWKDQFHFDETGRSSVSVQLHDPSRGVKISINLARGEILYAPDGKSLTSLYTISSASAQSRVPGSNVAWDAVMQPDSGQADANGNIEGDGMALDCSNFGTARTSNPGAPATVTFQNDTDGYRSVFWLDAKGQPQPYANLNAGESYVQKTYADSPWMITDGPGNCTEIYVPDAGTSTFHITAEADGDGGE